MTKFVVGGPSDRIYQALYDAGIVEDEPSYVSRVVIDLKVNEAARIYINRFADDRIVEVLPLSLLDKKAKRSDELAGLLDPSHTETRG